MNQTSEKGFATLRNTKFLNVPIGLFMILAVILWISMGFGWLPASSLGIMAFLLSIALPLNFIGKNTPFLGKYLGFGALLTIFAPSLLVTVAYISEDMKAAINSFTNDTLVPLNIGLLVCGSMLGKLDRSVLLKAMIRYIPVILLSMICTVAVVFVTGPLLGYTLFDSVVVTAFPCFSGGSGAPMANIPVILNEAGYAGESFIGLMMAALTLSNVEAIIFSGVLDTVGKLRPSWTGNGTLVRSGSEIEPHAEAEKFDGKIGSLLCGILVAAMLYTISTVIATILKPVINLNYVVWLILLCLGLKLLNAIPKQIENSVAWASDLVVAIVLPALMAGVGIGTIDLVGVIQQLNVRFFLLVTLVVVAYVVFSMIFGRLFGLYPIESGISVGCCSCNLGGTGDLICCQVAKRLDLYPFASISTRLGGAIALVFLSLLLQFMS